MVNRNWFNSFDGNRGQNPMNFAQELPMQTAPTQFGQPQVSPTQQFVQRNVTNTVVPHYHPSHLTTVNQQHINNQHYFPHTQSVVNECYETNTMCETPFRPNVSGSRHGSGCGCSKRRGW
ncbi:CotD family spore coat protein [Lysinibacillus sp. 2017]|uniref:CotD family spore coat protein n=1 Tax=unclassified Lysinibacillus TaxID=2636778 RepID=UPI00269EE812